MKKMSRQEYRKREKQWAEEAFRAHTVVRSWGGLFKDTVNHAGNWSLRPTPRPGGGLPVVGRTDVQVLRDGSVLVHGDIDLVRFSRFSPFHPLKTIPMLAIRWVATSEITYLEGKAKRGMGHHWSAQVFKASIARQDIEEYLEEEYFEDPRPLGHYTCDNEWELSQELYADGLDTELMGRVGHITNSPIFYAWAACKRLWELERTRL